MSTMTINHHHSSTSGFEVTWMYSVTEYLHLNTDCSHSWFLSNVFSSLSVAFSRLLYRCLIIIYAICSSLYIWYFIS